MLDFLYLVFFEFWVEWYNIWSGLGILSIILFVITLPIALCGLALVIAFYNWFTFIVSVIFWGIVFINEREKTKEFEAFQKRMEYEREIEAEAKRQLDIENKKKDLLK